MRFEVKIIVISLVLSFLYGSLMTYISALGQKTYYVYQVGIYKEKSNRDSKLKELEAAGYQGQYYEKEKQYYVLSLISEDYDQIEEHSQHLKGIIKEYTVDQSVDTKRLLNILSKGEEDD